MDRLTDVHYWEEQWWKKLRPQKLRLYRDFDYETVQLLRREAGTGKSRVLEMGAGGSRVLPYLAAKFGNEIYGADFSPSGCLLLRANMALVGVKGDVVCEDMFRPSLAPEHFDLVFSSGLIEHFEDTRAAIVQHLRLVRPGGRLALIVPNFQGLQGKIWQHLAPPLSAKHRIFGPAELEGFLTDLGLAGIRSGYLGSFFLHIGRDEDWTVVRQWPGWAQWLAHGSARLASGAVSLGFRLLPLRPHSRFFSTAFFASGVKPAR